MKKKICLLIRNISSPEIGNTYQTHKWISLNILKTIEYSAKQEINPGFWNEFW